MDVRCDRCSTEYEFDDALVSERGTSVRCTNCGHQFKVWRAAASGSDSWTVRTADGREFVFYSLRELQRAILGKQVQRSDQLVRGTERRVLGGIPELVTFFVDAERAGSVPPPRAQLPTPMGLGAPPPAAGLSRQQSLVDAEPPARQVSLRQLQDLDPPTIPVPALEPEPATTRRPTSEPPRAAFAPPAQRARALAPPDDELDEPPPRKQGRGGAVFLGIVAVLALGAAAVVLAPKLMAKPPSPTASGSAAPAGTPNAKVAELVVKGERALTEGDLDGARDALIRASALDEHDPKVAVALANLAILQADVAWLRVKLLPPGASDARAIAKAQLDDLAKRAEAAVASAKRLAPDDPAAARAEVDALRLAGAQADAKARAAKLSPTSPLSAYSVATVEMGDAEPRWSGIADRLRLAAASESPPGRARATLAYALARAGDAAGAKAELDRLAAAPRPYPLLAELRASLDKEPRDAGADAAVDAGGKATDIAALPAMGAAPGGTPVAAAPVPAAPGAAPPSGGGDDYSEAELQKRLFGEHGGGAKPPSPAPAPAPTKPPPAPAGPHIDTSDLPGVTPP